MAKSKKEPKDSNPDALDKAEVLKYLETLEHPDKPAIEEVRNIILSSNSEITEHIKWKAPSFCFKGDDRITFNFHGKKGFRLVFHCGAKVKIREQKGRLLDDKTGLLEWQADDRAIIIFHDLKDTILKKDLIRQLVVEWLKVT